jgi:hypothetical protein
MEMHPYSHILHTIYTGKIYRIKDAFMQKVCKVCSVSKVISEFHKERWGSCKDCWNRTRRERYKKSICRHCSIEFRPGVEGKYRFCSEKCRFMDKVEINKETGCWIWTGHIQRKKGGYGTFVPTGERSGLAHRSSYRLFKGDIQKDSHVLHSCDNTICVSPNHLRLGNALENSKEKIEKGRANNSFPGEKSSQSKLKEQNIHEIRELRASGKSYAAIGKIYNVTPELISMIIRGKAWKHVKI